MYNQKSVFVAVLVQYCGISSLVIVAKEAIYQLTTAKIGKYQLIFHQNGTCDYIAQTHCLDIP